MIKSFIPEISSKIKHIKKGDLYLLIHPQKPLWTVVNKTGFEILKLCDGKRKLSDIALVISGRVKADSEIVLKDLVRFFEEFSKTGFLLDEQKSPSPYSSPLRGEERMEGGRNPQSKIHPIDLLFLHVTSRCNYKCKHCYFPERGKRKIPTIPTFSKGSIGEKELSTKEIFSLIDQFDNQGGKHLVISGGEPLLRKDIKEILKYASGRFKVSLLTNASLIDEEMIEIFKNNLLRRLKPAATSLNQKSKIKNQNLPATSHEPRATNFSIQISLDGSCASVNDSIRGNGYFEKAIKAIKMLKKHGLKDNLIICTTLMKQNFNDAENIIRLAENLQVPLLRFLPLRSEGRARENWKEINEGIGIKEYRDFYRHIYDLIVSRKTGVNIQSGLSGFAVSFSEDECKKDMWCSVGRELVISSNGDAYPCPLLMNDEFLLGNMREITIEEMKESEKFNGIHSLCLSRRESIEKCRNCIWKNFCQAGCAAMALMDKGVIIETDDLCEFRKKLYEDVIFEMAKNKKKSGLNNQSCF